MWTTPLTLTLIFQFALDAIVYWVLTSHAPPAPPISLALYLAPNTLVASPSYYVTAVLGTMNACSTTSTADAPKHAASTLLIYVPLKN